MLVSYVKGIVSTVCISIRLCLTPLAPRSPSALCLFYSLPSPLNLSFPIMLWNELFLKAQVDQPVLPILLD